MVGQWQTRRFERVARPERHPKLSRGFALCAPAAYLRGEVAIWATGTLSWQVNFASIACDSALPNYAMGKPDDWQAAE
jgi:hypothetical protein